MGSNQTAANFRFFDYDGPTSSETNQLPNQMPYIRTPIPGNHPPGHLQPQAVHMENPNTRNPQSVDLSSSIYSPGSGPSSYQQVDPSQQIAQPFKSFSHPSFDHIESFVFSENQWPSTMTSEIPPVPNAQNAISEHQVASGSYHLAVGKPKRRRSGSKELGRSRKSRKKTSTGQELTPDSIIHCQMWLQIHPYTFPPQRKISGIATALEEDPSTIERWFRANVKRIPEPDSAYVTTLSNTEDDALVDALLSKFRNDQYRCHKQGEARPQDSLRDENHRFACTLGCNKSFGEKGGWKRHEERNFPQTIWRCLEKACKPGLIVFLEKDKLRKHMRDRHKLSSVEKEQYDRCRLEIVDSKFPKFCIFRMCNKKPLSWRERQKHLAEHFERSERWNFQDWRSSAEENDSDLGEHSSDDSKDNPSVSSDSSADDSDNDDVPPGPGGGASGQSGRFEHSRYSSMANSNGRRSGEDPKSGNSSSQNHRCCKTQHLKNNLDGVFPSRMETFNNLASRATENELSSPNSLQGNILKTDHGHIEVVRRLGHGATAVVDEVRCGEYGRHSFARKLIHYTNHPDPEDALREVSIMQRLNHPHVVKYVASRAGAKSLTIVMEPVADHTLSTYLSTASSISLEYSIVSAWFGCLASGLQHIHRVGVTHGDIKPSNILIQKERIYYADFGLAKLAGDRDLHSHEPVQKRYAAPEMWEGRQGQASDVFSLGCVFLEIYMVLAWQKTAHLTSGPYATELKFLQDLVSDMKSISNGAIETAVLDTCAAMIRYEPSKRPKAQEIASWLTPNKCCSLFDKNLPVECSLIGTQFDGFWLRRSFTSNGMGKQAPMPTRTRLSHENRWELKSPSCENIDETVIMPMDTSKKSQSSLSSSQVISQGQSGLYHDSDSTIGPRHSTGGKKSRSSMLRTYIREHNRHETIVLNPKTHLWQAKVGSTDQWLEKWTQRWWQLMTGDEWLAFPENEGSGSISPTPWSTCRQIRTFNQDLYLTARVGRN